MEKAKSNPGYPDLIDDKKLHDLGLKHQTSVIVPSSNSIIGNNGQSVASEFGSMIVSIPESSDERMTFVYMDDVPDKRYSSAIMTHKNYKTTDTRFSGYQDQQSKLQTINVEEMIQKEKNNQDSLFLSGPDFDEDEHKDDTNLHTRSPSENLGLIKDGKRISFNAEID